MSRIPFLRPELPPLDQLLEDLAAIHASGVFSNHGPFERRLATELARYLDVAHCIPVANATSGLMLAIEALARRTGARKVLVPSFTFAATALAVEWAGFEPVWCDIDEHSWQPVPDREWLAQHHQDLALILACNTFGAPGDIEAWRGAAARHAVPLLIDSASGFGGCYPHGRRLGAAGCTEVFSMHVTKAFAVGEGGFITTDDRALAEHLGRLGNFGFGDDRTSSARGLNAKLPEIMAAIACRALERHDRIVARRRETAARYQQALAGTGIQFQRHGELSPYQSMPVRLPAGVDRAAVRAHLDRAGIETRQYFSVPLHRQAQFRHRVPTVPLATTERVAATMLSLPMSNVLDADDVDRIATALREGLTLSRSVA